MFTSVRTPRLFRKGARLLERGASEEALACFEALIVKDPTDAAAHAHVGRCNLQLGRFEAAMASFRRACELQPDEADYHTGLGAALLRLDRLPEALDAYQEAARLEPGLVRGVLGLADTFLCADEHELALSAYSRAAKLDTDSAAAQLGLGRTHLALGNHEEARHALNRAGALDPDNGAVFSALADLHAATGEDAEVLPAREEAARLQPFSAEAQATLGALYASASEWKKAFTCCQRALRLNPDLAGARETLAFAHERLKEQGDDEVLTRLRRMETRGQEEPEPVEGVEEAEEALPAVEEADAPEPGDAAVLAEETGPEADNEPVDFAVTLQAAAVEEAEARLETFDADLNAWLDEAEPEPAPVTDPGPPSEDAEDGATVVAFDFVVEGPETLDLGDAWSGGNGGGTREEATDEANPFDLDDAAIASCLDYVVGGEAETEPVTDFASVPVRDETGEPEEDDVAPLDPGGQADGAAAGLVAEDEEDAADAAREETENGSDSVFSDAEFGDPVAEVVETCADGHGAEVESPEELPEEVPEEQRPADAVESTDDSPEPGAAKPATGRFDALMEAGEDAYAAGDFEAALGAWADACAMPGAGPACHNNRAAALMALDRLEEAEAACRAALESDASYAVAHATLAELAAVRGDAEALNRALADLAALDETLAAEIRAGLDG